MSLREEGDDSRCFPYLLLIHCSQRYDFIRFTPQVFTLSRFYVDFHFVPFLSREDKKKKLRNLNVRLLSFISCFVANLFLFIFSLK